MELSRSLVFCLTLPLLVACSKSHTPTEDADGDADTDADSDADSDGDADTCFGACSADTCCPPPWDGNKHCTDITADAANCGACGIVCGALQTCQDSTCTCFDPLAVTCGTDCVGLATDPANCGGCGRACDGDSPVCQAGLCVTCEAVGLENCDGVCTRVQVDDASCGACGDACAEGTACVGGECLGGECEVECGVGSVCCDHVYGGARGCADLRNDPFNCGGCAVRCIQGDSCVDGGCGCAPWQQNCEGLCVDLQSDTVNCGACGSECGAGAPLCLQGECVECETWGTEECGGACVSTDFDQNNCGQCGHACAPDQYCNMGDCESWQ